MKKTFDQIWEDIHKNKEWGRYPSEEVIRFVARNYYNQDRDKVKILDFGCGAGANTWFLAREGFDTYAFDGSKTAVNKAKSYLKKENLNAKFQVADALEVSYPENYFDCIIDGFVISLSTLSNIISIYQKVYKLLLPGGKIFSTGATKSTTGWDSGIKIEEDTYKDLKRGLLKDRGTIHFFQKEEQIKILEKIGFKNINFYTMTRKEEEDILELWVITAQK